MAARKTVYLVLADRKTGKRLGVARLKSVAREIGQTIPRGTLDTYRGDYVAGGTRFDLLDPEHETLLGHECVATPVLKVRGDDLTRDRVYRALPRRVLVEAIANHDRTPRRTP